ncbi:MULTISPECIES: beta strand repeat-containing protein [unclassified Tolypothrix]|uniref:beta strand repeat-containing protein n=1 Tax=unclassified Tolypothrix TaxID=2649714 RepID=UPI0005EAC17A|nr:MULTISPECIES: filamentous hemagglutinin N-terminal domain-containing protein [unclassified Tolypothrix]BAY92717.1 filamentous hemagglutinin outer membrane protein [Microchaete diplosiphon NIES-3275]EKF05822.1 protein, filamentous hemagglutinin family [Tolypothrix sp. PCC 7601]MBE9081475.1 filamentous hemagglutinin N-terminal domain-containing protein [Tolypothrix sp. LEGE 11397]UYD26646.1 filamentous hemagglutinin N-terminal domain-containing protein [Tolypothrix sp. PCC 7712]UYD37495.1 fil
MNQIQNWLQNTNDKQLVVKQHKTKPSAKSCSCDRTTFPEGLGRILTTINLQPKLILCSFIFFSNAPAYSQINPDNTLGAESSRITPNVVINGANADKIDGGAVRGSNLFHSFSEFNINDGQRVYFGNPAGVQNILTRVTGGQASNILGTLGVDGNANLFLINPNGILFGQNARLDIRSSFVGTTANAVQFGNQGIFSATNPQAAPLLTINPSALLFHQINSQPITNQSQAAAGISPAGENVTGLRVADNQNLLLIGGNINLDGGGLRAYGGNIELAAINAPATVGLNIANNLPSVTIGDDVERGDISLSNGTEVNVRGADGGGIKIYGRNVNLTGESKLRAGIETGLGTANSQGGDILINATGTTTLTDSSLIANVIQQRAFGKSGDVNISTGSLNLDKDALINVSTIGQGDAGNIFIQAADTVSLNSNTGIFSSVTYGAIGNGGSVNIKANSLNLSDNAKIETNVLAAYQEFPVGQGNGGDININVGSLSLNQGIINASTSGQGNAGNILIQAQTAVSLTNNSGIYSYVDEGGLGNGGSIKIQAGSLSLIEDSEIDTRTFGKGNGGNIAVNAREGISLDGFGNDSNLFTRIISAVGNSAVGNAGDIELTTNNLSLTNSAYVSSSTLGQGDAGNIIINARDTISFDTDADAYSLIGAKAVGNGGDIQVKTGTLLLTNGSQISTNVLGQGNAGNINVEASDTIQLDGFITREFNGDVGDVTSGLTSSLLIGGVGKAGDIQVKTQSLFVTNGASLTTSTSGKGDAGNITINASDRVTFAGFSGKSLYNSQASSTGDERSIGNGGDISISTGTLLFQNGGSLQAFNNGQGNGGNIFVDAANTITFDGIGKSGLPSNASTYAYNGDAGSIQAKTGALFLTNGGYMSAVGFGLGKAGDIKIDARNSVKVDGVIRDVGLYNGSVVDAESSLSTSLLRGEGKGGDIEITTGSLTVSNRGILSSSTSGKGNAGNITINARDTVTFDHVGNAGSVALDNAIGNGGNIRINTGILFLTNGGTVNTFSAGQGNAGSIFIDTRDRVFVDGVGNQRLVSGAYSFATNSGNGGEIQVNTGTLSLSNGGNFSTFAQRNAGNITINARDAVIFDGVTNNNSPSGVLSYLINGGEGKGGDIQITTNSFTARNGGQLISSTFGKGDAGNITINARDTVTFDGVSSNGIPSSAFTTVENQAEGKGGEIYITTNSFSASQGGSISASTFGKGDAGNITINALDTVSFDGVSSNGIPSGAFTTVENQGEGKGGDINLITGSLSVRGGLISSTSLAKGDAGNITINARDTITLDGAGRGNIINLDSVENPSTFSGVFSSVTNRGTGKAGNTKINAAELRISNQAGIAAATFAGDGGNISLDIGDLLLLRNGGFISTTAGTAQAGGNGGNIAINSPFFVAVTNENSDVTANAFTGKGGNVNINVQNIFGIEARPKLTNQSDITASSQLGIQGQITITQPQIQPPQKLLELPTGIIDASTQFAQTCPRDYNAKPLGSFVVTGRGSLPPNVLEPLALTTSLSPLASLDGESVNKVSNASSQVNVSESQPIIEAQGLVITADGKMMLVAEAPTATPAATSSSAMCPGSE